MLLSKNNRKTKTTKPKRRAMKKKKEIFTQHTHRALDNSSSLQTV